MQAGTLPTRRVEPGDAVFACFLVVYGLVSAALIPSDFTDLCYLFSLEQGRWVTQEWVHPIWVPLLRLLKEGLGLFGVHGPMLVPVEIFNVVLSMAAFALLYRIARRFPGSSLAAAAALAVTAFCPGFWSATVRPTPYAAALLCQTLSLSLLVSERPVSAQRYAGAGALAGLAMGFHASAVALAAVAGACALWEPDPARTRRSTLLRLCAFAGGMLVVGAACWGTFALYYGIGASYFGRQDFQATFAGIEQTPRTSIYTSHSLSEQLATFTDTLRFQGGLLLRRGAALLFVLAVLLRLWKRARLTSGERRLAIAAVANFVALAGFFLINGTRNGFIFASLTLLPLVLAVAIRNSWIGIAALLLLTVPETAQEVTYTVRNNLHGASDHLLAEVRFLQATLGPHDVVLTPGSPFPEVFYLSHFNIVEVSADTSTHGGSEVPVVNPGAALRARVAWWLEHGSRVLYAVGDASTDFQGDVGGAEKSRQIFWRPETVAGERAPKMDALRAAVEASGLDLRDGPISPSGEGYAEIRLREPGSQVVAPSRPVVTPSELRALFRDGVVDGDPSLFARRAQYLFDLETALPGDPWLACDVMELVCRSQPRRAGQLVPCEPVPGCDAIHSAKPDTASDGRPCFWAPVSDRKPIDDYLGEWARSHRLGPLSDWGFQANGSSAEMVLVLSEGTLALNWQLSESCAAGPITSHGISADRLPADQLQDLVEGLPVPKVHGVAGPHHP